MKLTSAVLATALLASSTLAVPVQDTRDLGQALKDAKHGVKDLVKDTVNTISGNNKHGHGHGHNKQDTPGGTWVKEPSFFTSAFSTRAIPSLVIANSGAAAPGQANAFGHFGFKVNSQQDTICWDIRTVNVTGDYSSPAVTATHIHQAPVGSAGPPRIAFPNPVKVGVDSTGAEIRESKGCQKGPFRTGVNAANGGDTGSASGFTLSQLEANPDQFFADTHTAQFTAGAIRGQLLRSETPVNRPKRFTSTLKTEATPNQVVNANSQSVPGLSGAKSYFELNINTEKDILCYEITSFGFQGDYFSPAKTATHTHQAPFGQNGPPRLAYKNPTTVEDKTKAKSLRRKYGAHGNGEVRYSEACVKGPFTTGLLGADGVDTGSASGFSLSTLENNPTGFFSDYHTAARAAGAVRGNMYRA